MTRPPGDSGSDHNADSEEIPGSDQDPSAGDAGPEVDPGPKPVVRPANPTRVTQAIISRREQVFGYLLAVYAAAGFLVVWIPILGHSSNKHHSSAAADLAIGLGMAVVLAATARWGRAYFLGAASLLVGLGPWNTASLLGFPALGLGGWMLFRTSRSAGEARRAARASAGPSRPQRGGSSSSKAAARSRSGTVRGSRRSGGRRNQTQGPVSNRPAASKRYTPPKH